MKLGGNHKIMGYTTWKTFHDKLHRKHSFFSKNFMWCLFFSAETGTYCEVSMGHSSLLTEIEPKSQCWISLSSLQSAVSISQATTVCCSFTSCTMPSGYLHFGEGGGGRGASFKHCLKAFPIHDCQANELTGGRGDVDRRDAWTSGLTHSGLTQLFEQPGNSVHPIFQRSEVNSRHARTVYIFHERFTYFRVELQQHLQTLQPAESSGDQDGGLPSLCFLLWLTRTVAQEPSEDQIGNQGRKVNLFSTSIV